MKRLPKIKELSAEYAEVLEDKKDAYAEYRLLKNEVQELVIAQRNVNSLYETNDKKEKRSDMEKRSR